jgi:hypothetical protein
MPVNVDIKGEAELKRLARDLKTAGRGDVVKNTARRMRQEMKPIVPDMRRQIRAIPSHGDDERSKRSIQDRPRGLRDAAARGVQVKVSLSGSKVSARIRIDPRHFPPGQKALPKLLDGTKPSWKHPTYGHKPNVVQRPHPFFRQTIHRHEGPVRAAMQKVLADMAAALDKGI